MSLPPFPMCPALPDSQYYGDSASLQPDQSTTNSARHAHAGCVFHAGKVGDLPVFTCVRSPKEAPGYLPAAPAGDYSVVLRRRPHPGKVTRSRAVWLPVTPTASCPRPPHIRRVGGGYTSRQVMTPVPRVYLFGLARRAHAIQRCWRDTALSGLLPPTRASPRPGCPQLPKPCYGRASRCRSFTSIRTTSASRRTVTS